MTFFQSASIILENDHNYNVGFRDDTRLISFANFEAHLSVCMESVLYK